MLKSLSSFQERLKERDPVNFKLKMRFVMGMKQTLGAVKLGKARLLLIAPDTESSKAIDEKLLELLSLCFIKDIPSIWCLNRRQLGKAIGATIKQSIVAVLNPDGVYDKFKKIVGFCKRSSDDAAAEMEDPK